MKKKNYQPEGFELLEILLEQSKYQNQLLGGIINNLDIMVCQLEKISKQTCHSLSEHHLQTNIQKHYLRILLSFLKFLSTKTQAKFLKLKNLKNLKIKLKSAAQVRRMSHRFAVMNLAVNLPNSHQVLINLLKVFLCPRK